MMIDSSVVERVAELDSVDAVAVGDTRLRLIVFGAHVDPAHRAMLRPHLIAGLGDLTGCARTLVVPRGRAATMHAVVPADDAPAPALPDVLARVPPFRPGGFRPPPGT